jgi:hypothetical protein
MNSNNSANVRCTENSKHKLPQMKLRGLVPNFFIRVTGIYIFLLYCVRELSAQPQEWRAGQELPQSSSWQQFPALPSSPAVELRDHIL